MVTKQLNKKRLPERNHHLSSSVFAAKEYSDTAKNDEKNENGSSRIVCRSDARIEH